MLILLKMYVLMYYVSIINNRSGFIGSGSQIPVRINGNCQNAFLSLYITLCSILDIAAQIKRIFWIYSLHPKKLLLQGVPIFFLRYLHTKLGRQQLIWKKWMAINSLSLLTFGRKHLGMYLHGNLNL